MKRSTASARLIAEAADWRLMGLLLERPRRGWHDEVAALASEVRTDELRATAAAARTATEGEYLSCLGPGGQVSPREVAYQPFADPGQLLAALGSTYNAFAFRPHVEEPLDHIAVEVAFVGYLLLKEAFALAGGNADAAAVTAAARRGFVEAHLASMAAPLVQRLTASGPTYLVQCGRLLAARVPAAPAVQLRPSPLGDSDACGACGLSG